VHVRHHACAGLNAAELRTLLGALFGPVEDIAVMRQDNRGMGFGFVRFADAATREKAVNQTFTVGPLPPPPASQRVAPLPLAEARCSPRIAPRGPRIRAHGPCGCRRAPPAARRSFTAARDAVQ
jgi:hypothetical protein